MQLPLARVILLKPLRQTKVSALHMCIRQVKLCDPTLTHAIPERFRDKFLMTNRQGCKRDLSLRDRDETETFGFWSETRPRRLIFATRRDRDRDVFRDLQPSSRLATIDMDRKLGSVPPFLGGGELGLHLTQGRVGRGVPPYQVAS